jgi:hypothetical protein
MNSGKKLNNYMKTKELEDLIRKIVQEEISKYFNISEGIDIDAKNLTVSFNPNHQENVDTNDPWNPMPIYNTVNNHTVISIFLRKDNKSNDGNPLIYALKQHKWHFKNPDYDLHALLRRFVAVTKELNDNYDTLLVTPSSNELNRYIFSYVKRLLHFENDYQFAFVKNTANDVYERFIETTKNIPNNIHSRIYKAIRNMNKDNNGIFSYKFLPKDLRSYIGQTIGINADLDDLAFADAINDKKVLIIDDTVTSGKTISDSSNALLSMYAPKSITFLTLFSSLDNKEI